MPLKRSYQVQSKYTPAKRSKTLQDEVRSLKKQVSRNKHELKYYEGEISFSSSSSLSSNSFIIFPGEGGTPTSRAEFLGRKIYVHKIEYRYDIPANTGFRLIYRNKKGSRNPTSDEWPVMIDPEHHTALRYSEGGQDTTKDVYLGTIDFKGSPRLVEFENLANDTGTDLSITSGDIRWYADSTSANCNFRVWYTDS